MAGLSMLGKQRGWRGAGAWCLVAAAALGAAFVLPFAFPSAQPVFSATWMAGADNRAAALGLAALSCAVLVWRWRWAAQAAATAAEDERLSPRWLWGAIAVTLVWTGALGWLVLRAHTGWGDEGYFLTQLRTGLLFRGRLYQDFEFPYGPALYFWPVAFVHLLRPLGVSIAGAYLVSLAAMQGLGVGLLFALVRMLPLRRGLQAWAFGLIVCGSLTPVLGLNYTLVRAVLPLTLAMWLAQQMRLSRAVALAAAGELLALAVSPECGLAFAGAALVLGALQTRTAGLRRLSIPLAALAGALGFLALGGAASLGFAAGLARGEYNLLIEPVPHVLLLVLAVVALAPVAVACSLRGELPAEERKQGQAMLALYAASLGLLPAALGRCDAVHCFFEGVGFYLLAFVAAERFSPRWRMAWVLAFAAIVLLGQRANVELYGHRLRLAIYQPRALDDWTLDAPALEKAIGSRTVCAPRRAPLWLEEELTRTGQYRPGYFAGVQGMWDAAAEARMIAGMRQNEFALVPVEGMLAPTEVGETGLRGRLGFGLLFHARHPAYVQGALVERELAANWHPAGAFGSYILYARMR